MYTYHTNVTISTRFVYYNILYCKYIVTWKGKSDISNGTGYQSKLIIVHTYYIYILTVVIYDEAVILVAIYFLMKNIMLSRDLGRTLGWSYVDLSL